VHLAPHPALHPVFETLAYTCGYALYRRSRSRSGDILDDDQRWLVIAAAAIGALLGSRILGLLEQAPRIHLTWQSLFLPGGKTIALTGATGPVWVHGNAEALFRAVRNLVENSIRHTPAGVSIEVELTEDGVVRVADDGPGVPESDREAIFRRFWRRDRGSTEGRGLGLAIVSRVAEAHDGSITVEDRPGGGAVFTLRLMPAAARPA